MPGGTRNPGAARAALLGAGLALALAGAACNDSEKVESNEVTGLWHATSVEYVEVDGPARVDLVELGATATLNLDADGTLVYTLTPAGGGAPQALTATWELLGDLGDLMRVTPTGASWYWAWDVACKNNTMRLTGAGGEYDFDDDGTREAARWNLSLER